MPVVAVINRKGGSGKSTLATHLAGYFARLGLRVMLGDVDRQQSSLAWLRRRAAQPVAGSAPIVGWAIESQSAVRPPAGVTHVVLDTPGGLRGLDLARVVMNADAILMPVCASVFDRESALECYVELMTLPRVANGRCKIAMVGMRLDTRTRAGDQLAAWAAEHKLPWLGALRETQVYVRSAEQGLTLFDLPASKVPLDLEQWQPVVDFVQAAWQAAERAAVAAKPAAAPVPPSFAATAAAGNAPVRPPSPAHRREPRAVPDSRFFMEAVTRASRPSLAARVGRWLTVFRPAS
jgi:chromosome partitioning protein